MTEPWAVVVPWHNPAQRDAFLEAWGVEGSPDWLVLQHDKDREGCGVTKNKGIREATARGAEIVVVLDDDCYPCDGRFEPAAVSLEILAKAHVAALQPQRVPRFAAVTYPPSRGTPYRETELVMPVAASMGFWVEVGDHCAVRQLAFNGEPMTYFREPKFGRYFPLSGMNLAFRPADWLPWCQFIDVPRFDDIWMGWLWQREAYRRGYCFNLNGPTVRHVRQSNVWANLQQEARYLEANETLWQKIAMHPQDDYDSLRSLLPV